MTTYEFGSVIESQSYDESKHVRFTLGQVLGVDDFEQQFAYLAGRDRLLARKTVGYGTLQGLNVRLEANDPKGPRILVEPGAALTPNGYLVTVRPAQCAYLDDWLLAKRLELQKGNALAGGKITAHVVVGYRDCATDPVLVPGMPCRTEDEMKIPSRISDSFLLEIRQKAPWQNEDDAIVDYVAWLRRIAVGGGVPTPLADFEAAAAKSANVIASPPEAPQSPGWTKLRFDPPATPLRIDPARIDEYLRAALKVWVTQIRPLVQPLFATGDVAPEDLVLLARLDIPIAVQATGEWTVDRARLAQLVVDDSGRPTLLHTRMVQELAIGGLQNDPMRYRVVAAGIINSPGAIASASLAATSPAAGKLKLTFNGYQDPRTSPPSFTYIVKAMLTNATLDNPKIAFESFDSDGLVLHITQGGGLTPSAAIMATPFMIEISRLG